MNNSQATIMLLTLCATVQIKAQVSVTPTPTHLPTSHFFQHLTIIKGDKSVGSGFIAMLSDKPFLFTNTHMLSGNKKIQARLLSGKPLCLLDLTVGDPYDVSIFSQATVTNGLEILQDLDSQVSIGDEVVVLGNSLGAGVATELKGKVTGVGPQRIEIDAKFVEGNSGSPVIHLKTRKVIGIATFSTIRKTEGFGKDSQFNNVERRFAYRLDNVPRWHTTTWQAFTREAGVILELKTRTDNVWDLAADISKNGQVTYWDQHLSRKNHIAQSVRTWQRELAKSATPSPPQRLSEKRRFLYGVRMTLKSDLSSINPNILTSYHRKEFEEIRRQREALTSYFQVLDDQLSNDPQFFTR